MQRIQDICHIHFLFLRRFRTMISKKVVIATRDELERMFKLAHCDGKNGFECKINDYLVILE